MTCKCAYAKIFSSRGDTGYYCRNEKRKKDTGADLCEGTHTYSTGHSHLDVTHNFEEMLSCGYRKTELTIEEKNKFDNEDREEKETLRKLKKDLDKMTHEDWERLKIQAYADY